MEQAGGKPLCGEESGVVQDGCWKTCDLGGRGQGPRMSEKEKVVVSATTASWASCHSRDHTSQDGVGRCDGEFCVSTWLGYGVSSLD